MENTNDIENMTFGEKIKNFLSIQINRSQLYQYNIKILWCIYFMAMDINGARDFYSSKNI